MYAIFARCTVSLAIGSTILGATIAGAGLVDVTYDARDEGHHRVDKHSIINQTLNRFDPLPIGAGEPDCETGFVHGMTGSGITGLGNWILTDVKVWDDGNGPALYVTGRMDSIDGVPVTNIAKWDGTSWSSLGDGVGEPGTSEMAWAMQVFDDGTGEKLYVGGSFTHASNVPGTARIAKWDGTQWLPGESEGTTMIGSIYSLAVADLGNGPRIFASGSGGANTRVWESDGGTFTPLPGIFNNGSGGTVWVMQMYHVAGIPYLFVGGDFNSIHGTNAQNLVRWNGSAWQNTGSTNQFGHVRSMTVHDDGDGPALYIGGRFTTVANGNIGANRIARYKSVGLSANWSALGSGMTGWPGCSSCIINVFGLASFDDGSGPALYAVGNYTIAGGNPVDSIAKWQDGQWHAIPNSTPVGGVGSYVPHFHSLAAYESCGLLTPSDEPALFIAGNFISVGGNEDRFVTKLMGCGKDETCNTSTGDLNCDGFVNVSDLLILLASWGSCNDPCGCDADLNGDDIVNVSDLLILLGNWG
jgi:hypothetical protein